jgi:hypothetical protein
MNYLILLSILLVASSCQFSPSLAETRDFNHHDSRFYLHTDIKDRKAQSRPGKRIFIDNQEAKNLDELDKKGLSLRTGEHRIKITDENSGSSKDFNYKVEPDKEYHLFYCENDDSVHWYAFDKNQNKKLDQVSEVCRPLGVQKTKQ